MARYILDNPDTVRGKRVLDFAAGCGVAALAAKRAGSRESMGADIDAFAKVAMILNAQLNGLAIDTMRWPPKTGQFLRDS